MIAFVKDCMPTKKVALKPQSLLFAPLYLICCLGTFNKAFAGVGVLGFSGKWAVCRDCTWIEGIGLLLSTWPILSASHFWKDIVILKLAS